MIRTITSSKPETRSIGELVDEVYGPWLRGMNELWTRALDPKSWPRLEPRTGGCEQHPRGGCDPCACEICDADLAVVAYPGELRVFPITVENTRPHERQITAEISGWATARGERVDWPTRVTPAKFTLAPCSEKTLLVRVHLIDAEVIEDKEPQPRPVNTLAVAPQPRPAPAPVSHACTVHYADLRLTGCEVRPIRLAVALLPESCGAYHARCGCCCP